MIRFGHSWNEIQEYTYDQLRLFVESAREIEVEDRRARLIESALAAQGDSSSIKQAIEDLGG